MAQISPDGRFWWDGTRWVPVEQPAPSAHPLQRYQQAAYQPGQQAPQAAPASPPLQPQGFGPPPVTQPVPRPMPAAAPAAAWQPQPQAVPSAPWQGVPVSGPPMGRWQRGLALARVSWQVLRDDRELLILPVLSFTALAVTVLLILGVVGIGAHLYAPESRPALYVVGFLVYVLTAFITYFFNAALIGAATIRLRGGSPTIGDGLRMAGAKAGQIFAWAIVAATVGQLIRLVQQRLGLLGGIVGSLLAIAWNVLTAFVVPVLVFEERGIVDSISRSAQIFRQRWGENFVGNGAIGLVLFLFMLPGLIVGGLLCAVSVPLGIALLLLVVVVAATIGSAMSAIFRAALYQFAVSGEAIGGFTPEMLAGAFQARRRII